MPDTVTILRVLVSATLVMICLLTQSGCARGPAVHTERAKLDGVPIALAEAVDFDNMALDVNNIRGSVRIVVQDWRDEPHIEAKLRWERPRARPADTTRFGGSDAPPIDVRAESEQAFGQPPVLRITTRLGGGPDPSARADLKILVPAAAGVRVRTSSGDVTLRGVTGAVTVENGRTGEVGGRIVLRTDAPLDAPVALVTSAGPITILAPTSLRADLDLFTAEGRSLVVAPKSDVMNASGLGSGTWSGQIGGGEQPFLARTGGGDVRVYAIENPMMYTPPTVHVPDALQRRFVLGNSEFSALTTPARR